MRVLVGTTVIALAGLMCASCASEQNNQQSDRVVQAPVAGAESASAPATNPKAILETFGGNVLYDFNELATAPEDFVDNVDIVVRGTVRGYELGPISGAKSFDDQWAQPTTVMSVRVDETWKGPAKPGDLAYFMLDNTKPDGLGEALPPGSEVALYGIPAIFEEGAPVGNPNAGRPAGEPLWSVGPHTFLVANGDEGVVFPLWPKYESAQTLQTYLPKQQGVSD